MPIGRQRSVNSITRINENTAWPKPPSNERAKNTQTENTGILVSRSKNAFAAARPHFGSISLPRQNINAG